MGVPHGVNSKHNTLPIPFQNSPRYRISHGLGKILSLSSRNPVTGHIISNLPIQQTGIFSSYNISIHPSQFNHAEDADSIFFRNVGTFNPYTVQIDQKPTRNPEHLLYRSIQFGVRLDFRLAIKYYVQLHLLTHK